MGNYIYIYIYNIKGNNGQFSLGELELSPSLISSLGGIISACPRVTGKTRGPAPLSAGRPPIKGRREACGHICGQCLTAKALRVK